MAGRKSFVIYRDWEKAFSRLSVMQMGTLFLALFAYVNQGQPYEEDDQAVGIAFDFARTTLDRDNEKYQARCAANARNGQKGGRPRKDAETAENPPETDGFVETAEGQDGAIPLPPEPDVFFDGPEEPAAFAEQPAGPAGRRGGDQPSRGCGTPPPEPPRRTGCPVGQTYGSPPPMSAGRAERSFEQARQRVIQQLQRKQFESYVPPAGGW